VISLKPEPPNRTIRDRPATVDPNERCKRISASASRKTLARQSDRFGATISAQPSARNTAQLLALTLVTREAMDFQVSVKSILNPWKRSN
jgi:hypothetical protein